LVLEVLLALVDLLLRHFLEVLEVLEVLENPHYLRNLSDL
jgi:hypothetical protein